MRIIETKPEMISEFSGEDAKEGVYEDWRDDVVTYLLSCPHTLSDQHKLRDMLLWAEGKKTRKYRERTSRVQFSSKSS